MRGHRWLQLLLVFCPVVLLAQDAQWVRPTYNFSSYELLIRRDLLQTGATFIFYDQNNSGLNGFYAPTCVAVLDGKQRILRNAIAINLDLVLLQGLSPNRILAHELTHYRQRLRSGSLQAYLREWRRQQRLPYELRPWEREAEEAELRAPVLVQIVGRRPRPAVSIVFESEPSGVAASDAR